MSEKGAFHIGPKVIVCRTRLRGLLKRLRGEQREGMSHSAIGSVGAPRDGSGATSRIRDPDQRQLELGRELRLPTEWPAGTVRLSVPRHRLLAMVLYATYLSWLKKNNGSKPKKMDGLRTAHSFRERIATVIEVLVAERMK